MTSFAKTISLAWCLSVGLCGVVQSDEIPVPGRALSIVNATPKPISVEEYAYKGGQLHPVKRPAGDTLELPAWTTNPSALNGDELVIASQRFATLEEAGEHGTHELQNKVNAQVRKRLPRSARFEPTIAELAALGVVTAECRVTWPLEVGGFTEPVHQIYWRVRLDEETTLRLVVRNKPLEQRNRLFLVAGGFACVWGVMGWRSLSDRRRNGSVL
ncbi:hypothetical protein [Planctomicrobium sp. SH664]|uniref:hypothetical protein n=1 Tax=Planctomicrobium sp. SH664 TaxID=3448125 RepID=UPI003F5C76EA